MSSRSCQASLLDALMGPQRNLEFEEQKRDKMDFVDSQVCKKFLCGFCPNQLFINTKSDLGPCEKIHEESLQQEYTKSEKYQCLGYEIDFARILRRVIRQMDSTIRKRQEKLIKMSNPDTTSAAAAPSLEKIAFLQNQIDQKSKQAELLGSEGNMTEACQLMDEIDKIEEEKKQSENVIINLQQESEKKQRICEICGAYLVVGDPQHRLDEHLKGKLHSGAYKIREYLKNYDKIEEFLQDKLKNYETSKYKPSASSSSDNRSSRRSHRSDSRNRRSPHRDSEKNHSSDKYDRKSPNVSDSEILKPTMRQESPEAGELRRSSESYERSPRVHSRGPSSRSYHSPNYNRRHRGEIQDSYRADRHKRDSEYGHSSRGRHHSARENGRWPDSSPPRRQSRERSRHRQRSRDAHRESRSRKHADEHYERSRLPREKYSSLDDKGHRNFEISRSTSPSSKRSHRPTSHGEYHDTQQHIKKSSKYSDPATQDKSPREVKQTSDSTPKAVETNKLDESRDSYVTNNPYAAYSFGKTVVKSERSQTNGPEDNYSYASSDSKTPVKTNEISDQPKTINYAQLENDVKEISAMASDDESNKNVDLKIRERKQINGLNIKNNKTDNFESSSRDRPKADIDSLMIDVEKSHNDSSLAADAPKDALSKISIKTNESQQTKKAINMMDWDSE
ncbi:MAG: Luc7-like protein 3 [Marteilia pararefringens]